MSSDADSDENTSERSDAVETPGHPDTPDAIEEEEYDVVDFYATTNFAEVDMLLDILRDNGIVCFTREMEPPGLPVNVGHEGEIRILVQNNKLDRARELLEEAVAEGPVPDDGQFLRE